MKVKNTKKNSKSPKTPLKSARKSYAEGKVTDISRKQSKKPSVLTKC